MNRRILMVAGEASGDTLGAGLASALRRAEPSVSLYGVGGPAMREAGVETFFDASELGVMGFSELGREGLRALGVLARLRRELRRAGPDLFVPIDFPDFNLPLCRTAHRAGVRVFYYVSPQVWAWRSGRVRTIARNVDRLLVLFPFEADFHRGHGVDAHFVGHPLAETVVASTPRGHVREQLGVGADEPLVALLPGSRRREVEGMLPSMLEALRLVGSGTRGVVAAAPSLPTGLVEDLVAAAEGAGTLEAGRVAIVRGDTYNLVAASDAALVTSGTATLECALLGCPMVVAYRLSSFSHALARRLVKVPFIAMPNLLLGRRVVPELVQDEATPLRMAQELGLLLGEASRREAASRAFGEIRRQLVLPGAADRAAALALELLA